MLMFYSYCNGRATCECYFAIYIAFKEPSQLQWKGPLAIPAFFVNRAHLQHSNKLLLIKTLSTKDVDLKYLGLIFPYRNCKLFRCYMAVGYIARYIWLCSHEIDGHVYMAKQPVIHGYIAVQLWDGMGQTSGYWRRRRSKHISCFSKPFSPTLSAKACLNKKGTSS